MTSNADYQRIAIGLALGAGALYVVAKVLRGVLHQAFPSFVPGEPNTILLATPRPNLSGEVTAKDLESVRDYDYVIIGTGTAGCVLANRLSEDSSSTVLAIEAGHSDLKQIFSRIPAAFARLFGTAADWNFYTEKDKGCSDRKLFWPRGKMLGGCSAINAMIYNKGAPDDYNEWARDGNDGWSYKDLLPYMTKAEGFQQSARSALSKEDLAEHGRNGPWQTGYSHLSPMTSVFLDACAALGIPKVRDVNTAKGMVGASAMQTFIDSKGQRSSTAVAYLTQDVASRPNLKIATGQTVTKIIFDTTSSPPRAVGVELAASKLSPVRYLVKARKEIILSAGALQSPHVLKLSGIGPAAELKRHGIAVVKDSPGVGENLVDHLCGMIAFEANSPSLQYLFHPVNSLPDLIQWFRKGTGAMTSNVAEGACFVRTVDRPDAPASLRKNDLSSGPTSADLEILTGNVAYIDHGRVQANLAKNYFSVGPIMLRPESRGDITLASASPFDAPIINANYLATQHDRDMMVYGMRLSRDLAATAPFKTAFSEWYFPSPKVLDATDAELLDMVRNHSETIYHPMCTVKMGPAADKTAVIDSKLKVHGIDGLRVVDASIFPKPVACHPCAPTVMVAEKAADLIKQANR